ncbi:MAG: nitroreductase family deazaflavin-dependent oxidoreductase [Chloroflexi bacterium]|nr:nitroreductase family deazaflavin-dependent oxidoreductase [Chloroflexota bacterium]MBI5081867.1 nitroreductase family deazaflavin-dependent oxidoreductase [Chloroflexota bacterium]MBI5348823.1 nitroreductase family deazaflavin-dependent oxidoreductase [Chloroflexota bacterium]MBI5712693.1 nitroreductase family deazaflavin-dependent oxidoreductase [Chloroflexota bacterium]
MTINDLYNPLVRFVLRSPLHPFVSKSILLISFTGRKSGKPYSTPINYAMEGDTITLISKRSRTWWKNLQGGAPVTVIVRGQERCGTAEAVTPDDPTIIAELQKVYSGMPRGFAEKLVSDTVVIKINLN